MPNKERTPGNMATRQLRRDLIERFEFRGILCATLGLAL
jgi:hypothetical protein